MLHRKCCICTQPPSGMRIKLIRVRGASKVRHSQVSLQTKDGADLWYPSSVQWNWIHGSGSGSRFINLG